MKNTLVLSAALAAVLTAGTAFAEGTETSVKTDYKKNGGYEKTATTSTTTAGGTAVKSENSTDVDVDSNGKVTKTIKDEKVTDPDGMMNEKRNTTETKVKEKDRGYERTTKSSNTDAEGTSVSTEAKQNVKVDAQGNVIETIKTEKSVDPKGLMNKSTSETETKKVNGQVVK